MSAQIWVFGDYGQAESRVCAWRGPIPLMKQWYLEGRDTHLGTAKLIGKFVQENKLKMPHDVFRRKPWEEFTKDDEEERDIGKKSNHANNYGLGKIKFATISGLPLLYAEIIQNIHHSIFPEIRSGYQQWIKNQLSKDRVIHLPPPFKWKKTFYGLYDSEMERAGFAFYPQSTVGHMLVVLLNKLCNIFNKDGLKEARVLTPEVIRSAGFDVQLQVHDSVGISIPNSQEVIQYVCRTVKKEAEMELLVGDAEPLIIPMDFKIGPNWGELKAYKDF